MEAIKKMKDLILKKIGVKLLTSNLLVTSKTDLIKGLNLNDAIFKITLSLVTMLMIVVQLKGMMINKMKQDNSFLKI